MTADFVIISSWPNGVYLSKKLSEISKTVCYIDIQNSPHRPMGVFLDEGSEEEKRFLESLGTLEKQEGGFCLLSEKGVWHFQEEGSPVQFEVQNNLQGEWLSFFSSGFMAPVFESNDQVFSKPLNLSSDYFLFYPHFKKKMEFPACDSNIRWFSNPAGEGLELYRSVIPAQAGIQPSPQNSNPIGIKEGKLFLFKESFPLEKVIGLGASASNILSPPSHSQLLPDWEWVSFDFSSDLRGYENIVPPHFVCINQLLFPWTHDNLLSVFHNRGMFHVWCRQPLGNWGGEDEEELILSIRTHLQKIFPEVPFQFLKKGTSAGLFVYGQESFSRLEEPYILQGDFMEQIKKEVKIFNEVTSQ